MPIQTAVIVGATGLVGEALARHLSDDPRYSGIRLLVRREPPFKLPKTESVITNFDSEAEIEHKLGGGDVLFCCVGTTQSRVKGNKTAYRKVDFDIPVNCGRLALRHGFTKMLVVSAVGANAKSSNFYLKLKGETEDALTKIGFPSLHIYRPSFLIGKRREFRFMEKIAHVVFTPLSGLLRGRFSKYRAIEADDIAKAMANCAEIGNAGTHVYHYDEMIRMARAPQHSTVIPGPRLR